MSLFSRPSTTPGKKAEIGIPAFFDVARQQSELIQWVGTKIQEHEAKIEELTQQLQDLSHDGSHRQSSHPLARRATEASIRGESGFTPRKWSQLKRESSASVGTPKTPAKRSDSLKSKGRTKPKRASTHSNATNESHIEDSPNVTGDLPEVDTVAEEEPSGNAEDEVIDEALQQLDRGLNFEELAGDMDEETKQSLNAARARKSRQLREEEDERQRQSLKFENRRPSELSLEGLENADDDQVAQQEEKEAPEYALISEMNQKFDDFSQYMAEEMGRLDNAICTQMETRMQDFVADTMEQGMNDLVQERLKEFQDQVKKLVDEKIIESMSDMNVDADDLDNGGFTEVILHTPSGSKKGSLRASPVDEEEEVREKIKEERKSEEKGSKGSDISASSPDVEDPVSNTPPKQPESVNESRRGSVPASRRTSIIDPQRRNSLRQENPEVFMAIKSLQLRLAPLEESLAELKPLRLQVPTLQSEMENLSDTMTKLYSSIEEADNDNNRRGSAHVSEVWSDNGERGALAGAHSPEEEAHRSQSVKTSGIGRGGSLGRYMSQGNAVAPGDPSKMDALSKRVDKLEHDTHDPVTRFADMEQLVNIMEDRLKELDTDYRIKIKEFDLRVGLQQSLIEREAASAQKVYESWDLDNQVDVILSVVQGEMRNVRMELDDMIKAAVSSNDNQDLTASRRLDGEGRGSVSQITKEYPLHDGNRGQTFDLPTGRRDRRDRDRKDAGSRSPSPAYKEQEEKVKRLQECYQQCTLKIAGLKSGNRHVEQQVAHTLEQIKKLAGDVEQINTIALKNEVRLDYLHLHANTRIREEEHKDDEKPTTFQCAVGKMGRNTLALAPDTPSQRGASPSHMNEPVSRDKTRKGSFRLTDHRELQRQSTRMMRRSSHRGIPDVPPTPHRTESPRPHGQENTDPNASNSSLSHAEQIDVNSGRLWRLGKKVNDMDNETSADFKRMKDEMDMMDQKLNMLVTFLPRRLRRMVERTLTAHKKDDEEGDKKEKGDSKHVVISEKAPDVRTFNADPETGNLPWQCVGEPDQKWAWCLQSRNDMGRDLARQFELMEDERRELEENIERTAETLRQEFQTRMEQWVPRRPVDSMYDSNGGTSSPVSPAYGGNAWGGASSESVEKINRHLNKTILPQMATLEDRLERLVKDVIEAKNKQESLQQLKADKDEIQLLKMRFQVFEKFDPKQIAAQVENLEVDGKHFLHLIDQLAEQCRKIESYAAHRQDMTKCKAEVTQMKTELHKLQGEQKEISSSVFNSNRQLSTIVLETKTNLEKHLTKLEVEKVSIVEYNVLQEKIVKLDSSMRDNRQILSDSSGGADMSQVVKRIILNMEDKIMLLEKKMDLLLEGRSAEIEGMHKQGENFDQPLPSRPPSTRPGTSAVPPVSEVAVENLGNELAAISEAVTILKQEVTLSKVNMDSIREQGAQASELAQRLNILVESPDGDTGTTLSLNRVQVMVAAAARQLVAGSKWVTQDIFDTRLLELRKECIAFMRQVQTHVDEVHSHKLQPQIMTNLGPKKLPSVVAEKQGRGSMQDSGIGFGLLPKRHIGTAPAAPGNAIEGSLLKAPLSARR